MKMDLLHLDLDTMMMASHDGFGMKFLVRLNISHEIWLDVELMMMMVKDTIDS